MEEMTEKEMQEFAEFLQNMSDEQFTKITREVEEEIFTKDFCKELNKELK